MKKAYSEVYENGGMVHRDRPLTKKQYTALVKKDKAKMKAKMEEPVMGLENAKLKKWLQKKIKSLGSIPTLEDLQGEGADISRIASCQHTEGYMLALTAVLEHLS